MTAHRFLLGRLCLDLAFSGGEGPYARFETLHDPADLAGWFAASPLAAEPASPTAADLDAGKQLRTAIWAAANAIVEGHPVAAADIAVINAAAAEPSLVPAMAPNPESRAVAANSPEPDSAAAADLRATWRAPLAAAALSDVARDAIALLADPAQRARLRRCASPDCALIFYDGSRPGRRRWCSTERCGDRMRARAYRARQRA